MFIFIKIPVWCRKHFRNQKHTSLGVHKNFVRSVFNLSSVLSLELRLVARGILVEISVFSTFDAYHNTWAPCTAGCMGNVAHSRTRRSIRRPSRRSAPCRTEPLPIILVGRSGWVGGVRRVRHQACELCTSDSRVPIGVPTKGRDRAPSMIYKRRTRFPPR